LRRRLVAGFVAVTASSIHILQFAMGDALSKAASLKVRQEYTSLRKSGFDTRCRVG
jgi:hypothetical protein